ncbi:MAG: YjbE family putative metal transport protein [Proteobacteria bacterium]|nr:YjbE family putative metal transport protein [Pseudomonadota bacterium]
MDAIIADVGVFLAVILIDLALSADNAVAVGVAAGVLPAEKRGRAIFWGVLIALLLRIALGLFTIELLRIRGVTIIGGVLLLWISWRMLRDLKAHHAAIDAPPPPQGAAVQGKPSFTRALFAIVVANIALSLDNVLAVAGVARNSPAIMVFGLVLSVLLMGVAANAIAAIVHKNRWIGYLGVVVIVFAAAVMIWDDVSALAPGLPAPPPWLGGHSPE